MRKKILSNDITRQWQAIAEAAISSMNELGNINVRMIEQLTEQQLAVLNTCFETSCKELELAAGTLEPDALLKMQSELIADYNSRLMNIFSNTTGILNNCNTEIGMWMKKSVMMDPTIPARKSGKK